MWPISIRRLPDERGYTLTELAVVMSVFLIFMSFAAPVMFAHLNAAVRTERRADLQQSGRGALRTMVREMRQAKELYSTMEKPSDKNRISFGVDFNADGVINDYKDATKALEQITYYITGTTLYRGRKQGQGVPIAENVTGMTFTMYGSNLAFDVDGDGVVSESELNPDGAWTATELANVTRVTLDLTLAQKTLSQQYSAEVWLRNRVVG